MDERRALLEEIMEALRHDEAAVVRLFLEFGEDIGAVVRSFVRRAGGVHLTEEDVQGLTFDACLALARVAGSWRADGGALPWVWARKRIGEVVAEHLGPYGRPLTGDEEQPDGPLLIDVNGDDPPCVSTLAALAHKDERCALVRAALAAELGPRDAEVFLRYLVQQDAGDPSPSHTVAAELGLNPPAVRKVASRARRKLAEAFARDDRYASLHGIALLQGVKSDAA